MQTKGKKPENNGALRHVVLLLFNTHCVQIKVDSSRSSGVTLCVVVTMRCRGEAW